MESSGNKKNPDIKNSLDKVCQSHLKTKCVGDKKHSGDKMCQVLLEIKKNPGDKMCLEIKCVSAGHA